MRNGKFLPSVFSLQRSEMFIATSATPKYLTPLGAKPGSVIFAGAAKAISLQTELPSKEEDRLAINISPLWGELTSNISRTSKLSLRMENDRWKISSVSCRWTQRYWDRQ
jgi:hypothetical protein